jgi:hypothetical protein
MKQGRNETGKQGRNETANQGTGILLESGISLEQQNSRGWRHNGVGLAMAAID